MYEIYEMYHLLFWLGLGLILNSVLVTCSCLLTCCLHSHDDTGSSGGLAGIENFCLPLFAPTFVLGGIFCMVGLNTWNLVLSIIFNTISVFVHMFACSKCTGCGRPEDDAEPVVKKQAKTAMIRVLPELIGIGLSWAAVIVALQELQK